MIDCECVEGVGDCIFNRRGVGRACVEVRSVTLTHTSFRSVP